MNTELDIDTPTMPAPHVRERVAFGSSGLPVLGLVVLTYLAAIALMVLGIMGIANPDSGPRTPGVVLLVIGSVLLVAGLALNGGLIMVAPGEARVLQFLGRYVGTVRTDGLRWVNP